MNIAILGAGLTGLSAAFDLAAAGHQVTIYEASNELGGLAAGFKAPHWQWSLEKYYHHWFQTDTDLLKLADEMGVRNNIIFPRPKTVAYYDKQFYALDSPVALLRFPGFGIIDKLRFGFTYLYLRYIVRNGLPLEAHTAQEWITNAMGKRVSDVLWRPMLEGKFGRFASEVNMAWLWARITTRTPNLGTYIGGFQAFADELGAQVTKRGVTILRQSAVQHIQNTPENITLTLVDGSAAQYDRVLATCSPSVLAKLAPQIEGAYRQQLIGLQNLGATVLILSIKKQLTDSYWFNLPKEAGYPFLALVEHTNFISSEFYGGDHILYCGDYVEAGHPYLSMSAEEMLTHFLPGIQRFNPQFDRSWVKQTWLFRTPYAQPLPFRNHSQNIPANQTPLPNLWFASMSQVYPYDRGTNYAVQMGRRVAKQMVA
jgi:protoporphyrinogen oxidase